jgi:hypothetical protein
MANAACTLVMTRRVTDSHNTGIAKGVNLCTSFTFTSGSRREGPQKGRGLWLELPAGQKNNLEAMRAHSFQTLIVGDCICG